MYGSLSVRNRYFSFLRASHVVRYSIQCSWNRHRASVAVIIAIATPKRPTPSLISGTSGSKYPVRKGISAAATNWAILSHLYQHWLERLLRSYHRIWSSRR